jgi:chlorophyllide a reductase subunit Y
MLVSYAKEQGIPAVYATSLLSVRPLFLAGGVIASISMARELLNRKPVYDQMLDFFTT